MKAQRNVEGLRQNAQKKRQQAIEQTNQAIKQLVKDGKVINFETVAEVAQVSKAWLYKELDIKTRIEQLRAQGTKPSPQQGRPKASDESKNALICTLRERVKKLEAEVRDLRKQNEVAYGQVIEVNSLRQQVGRLQAENDRLRQQLSLSQPESLRTSDLEDKVMALGVQLNSTIKRVIQDAPQAVIERAMESLKEATEERRAGNPSGFFYKALTDAWQPNEVYKQKSERELFNEWFAWAKAEGLTTASMQTENSIVVLTSDNLWMPFAEAFLKFPLAKFQ